MSVVRKLFVFTMLLFCSSLSMAQQIATGFIYPVGNQNSPPTEQVGNANGFHIAQHFNTSSIYGGSSTSPNGGWCVVKSNFDPRPSYTTKETCNAQTGLKWIYGHTGVDLSNRNCGGEIKATANGIVEFSGNYSGYGNLLVIKHILPNGRVVYSLYGHREAPTMSTGNIVTKGQSVGRVGNTGAGGNCHLHFAMFDQSMPLNGLAAPTGYVYSDKNEVTGNGNSIPSNIIRHFYDPLLFVSDRNNEWQAALPGTGYFQLSPSNTQSVTTRTMYAVNGSGVTNSLQAAVNSSWLNPVVYWWNGTNWSHYTNPWPIDSYTLSPGVTHAFGTLRSDLNLGWFLPGNEYLDARWRGDMAEFTTVNASLGFGRALRETYTSNPNWSTAHGLVAMQYEQTVNGVLGNSTVWVAYQKTDPLVRYVQSYTPQTSNYTTWIRVY